MALLRSAFVIASLSVEGLVVNWTVGGEPTFTTSKDVTKCKCALPTTSPLSLAIIDAGALACIKDKDFIEQDCSMTVTAVATSNQDDDAIVCAKLAATSFSELALDDCGYKISQVGWDKCEVAKAGNPITDKSATEIQSLYSQAFQHKTSTDVCTSDYWTAAIANTTTPGSATFTATQVDGSQYAVKLVPTEPLDSSLQWLVKGTDYKVTSLPVNGLNGVTTYNVSKTYDSSSKSECVGNDGALANAVVSGSALMLLVAAAFSL